MTRSYWAKVAQLCTRGAAMCVVTYLGVVSPDEGNVALFDRLFSVDAGKAAAVGAGLSLLFSVASREVGNPQDPTA